MKELEVSGNSIGRMAGALANETCLRILGLVSKRGFAVTRIADRLGLDESTVSIDIQELVALGLIEVTYRKGMRGIRKICMLSKDRVCFRLK